MVKGNKDANQKKGGKTDNPAYPDHIEQQRTHMVCGPERNHHVNTFTSANMFRPLGIDNSWDMEEFKDNFSIKINKLNEETMEFDMIGCDPAIANALRRILIAEIPTVAIEHVFIINNTSIIQDEVLAHRMGLVPLKIDPSLLEFKLPEEAASEKNTIVFKLDVTCKRSGNDVINDRVLSGQLEWLPGGSEIPDESGTRFAAGQAHLTNDLTPRLVHEDILLAKMRPGQSIVLEAHCIKGVGKEHAKWSPVATAWYRLQPEIRVLKEIVDKSVASELMSAAPGLFSVDASGKLMVANPRDNEKDLEKVRLLLEREDISQSIQLRKRKDHFIFTIESTGILSPQDLLVQAIEILRNKAQRLADKL